jgi:SsrA-binding protein
VKSIRLGKVNLKDSYADVKQGEVYLHNMHISPYEKGNIFNSNPMRDRKLLLNRREINKLAGYIQQKGYALVPLQLYLTRGLVKVQLAVAKGKKLYDKRSDAAKRDAQRSMERAFKESLSEQAYMYSSLVSTWGRTGFDGDNRGARSESRTPGPRKNLELKHKR